MAILVKIGIRCHRNAQRNHMTSSILIFFHIFVSSDLLHLFGKFYSSSS